jgi:hypothetical protein
MLIIIEVFYSVNKLTKPIFQESKEKIKGISIYLTNWNSEDGKSFSQTKISLKFS